MATATLSTAGFNLRTSAAYTIRLGETLAKSPDTSRYTGVRYNFKPDTSSSQSFEGHISTPEDDGEVELSIQDEDGAYTYSGRDSRDEESYVLVVRGHGKEQEMILERIDSCFGFDVTQTPTESNAATLSKRYPRLPLPDSEENGDDLFGDEDEDVPLDDENPFDYRHFLKAELDRLEISKVTKEEARSSISTPLVRPHAPSKATATKPVKRAEPKKTSAAAKRKAAAADKPNPKRVKAGQEEQVPTTTASASTKKSKPTTAPSVPEVRVDRKASVRQMSFDDSDDLILENENPADEHAGRRPAATAMSRALTGQLGPISLRSAASSPGSHMASPAPPRPSGMENEYTFDLGDSSSEASEHGAAEEEVDAGGDDNNDDDADVEDFELPSPENPSHRRHDDHGDEEDDDDEATAPMPPPLADDDDDFLSKQIEEAIAADDDGMGGLFGNDESDEESEEE